MDSKFPQPRLQIEAAPKKSNMCMFHLTIDHDSENCLETAHMMQLLATNELTIAAPCIEPDTYSHGDSEKLFLEYESNSKLKGECYATIDGTSYMMLTRGQKLKNQSSNHPHKIDPSPLVNHAHVDQGTSNA